MSSQFHAEASWCIVGSIIILYHTSISVSTSVTYDARSVFGSHGAYAVWTGTDPRSFTVSASLVGANTSETKFNMEQVLAAYTWTQESPPGCKGLELPKIDSFGLFNSLVRIESMDGSIPDGTHIDDKWGMPIQIDFSLSLKECRAI